MKGKTSDIVRVLHRNCGICGKPLFILITRNGKALNGEKQYRIEEAYGHPFVYIHGEKKRVNWMETDFWECIHCNIEGEAEQKWREKEMFRRKSEEHRVVQKYASSWFDTVKGFFGKTKKSSTDDLEGK